MLTGVRPLACARSMLGLTIGPTKLLVPRHIWVTRLPVYQSFVQRFFRQRRLARWVHEYQSRVAFVFASTDDG